MKLGHHIYQILTKRPERALEIAGMLPWAQNIWLGTSVESERYTHRVQTLQQVPSLVRFLSVEPLLGRISALPLEFIDWVIVGGESGPEREADASRLGSDFTRPMCGRSSSFLFQAMGCVRSRWDSQIEKGEWPRHRRAPLESAT